MLMPWSPPWVVAAEQARPEDPDLPLLGRIASGDQAAYALLLERHLDRILAFAERHLGERAEAEDVAQEVFLRAWQQAGRWQPRGARFSTWLHQVALNLCRDRWRRAGGEVLPLDETLPCPDPEPEAQAARADEAARVHQALRALPERQRAAVLLAHFQGLSNPEIGQVLDCSVEAVESLLSRARRSLKKGLLQTLITAETH